MNANLRRVVSWFAALLPAIGLLVMVAKAEVAVRNGPTFRIPISGYDPRDVLHGQYLRYQFDFQWEGEDTCGVPAPVPVEANAPVPVEANASVPAEANAPVPAEANAPVPAEANAPVRDEAPRFRASPTHRPRAECCLCVTRTLPAGFNPAVRQVDCGSKVRDCDGWIRGNDVLPPLRYFVPEERAQDLERALRDTASGQPSIEITLPRNGKPAIRELYLGDKPWREVLTGAKLREFQ